MAASKNSSFSYGWSGEEKLPTSLRLNPEKLGSAEVG
jgi:hypothetical protein